MLELGEEAFDAPAVLVGDFVVGMLVLAMTAGWNDGLATLVEDDVVKLVRIVGAMTCVAERPSINSQAFAISFCWPGPSAKRTGSPRASTTA